MVDRKQENLPALPENLEALHDIEEENRASAKLVISRDVETREHLDIVYASLNMLFDITNSYQHQKDDELTLQFLGLRMFNSITASLELVLAGYYQSSVVIQRDLLETGFLLDYFSIDQSLVGRWKKGRSSSQREFKPSTVRKALDKRDGLETKKRELIYRAMCEYAVHPNYSGLKLVAPSGFGLIGPFFEEDFMKALLKELAMRSPYFTLIYLRHFKNLPPQFLNVETEFIGKCDAWAEKYGALEESHLDATGFKELVKF